MKNILKLLVPKKYRVMYWRYRASRDFEREQAIIDIMSDQFNTKESGSFIDVGSNVGSWSDYATNKFENIYAFECNKDLYRYLKKKFSNKKIEIINEALGNYRGENEFYIPIHNGNVQEARASLIKPQNKNYEKQTIKVNTLDNHNFNNVKCIKIDVEGAELEVLLGGINTIKKFTPVIIIEIEDRHNKNTSSDVFNFFTDLNYFCYVILDGQISKLEIEKFNHIQENQLAHNFIFIHDSCHNILSCIGKKISWRSQ